MSAVAALWSFDGRPDAGAGLDRMLAALAIYGPDGGGRWDDGAMALGQCRMDLLPEDRFDRQPVTGADGQARLVAALRLDNRAELGDALGISPAALAGMADSRLLMAAYEHWDENCVSHLLGDFAFIVWDGRRRRLFAARDHLGQYPLFVHRTKNLLALASMPKGLLALPDVPRELDEARIAAHLVLLQPASLYRGIDMLPAGHCLSAGPDSHELRRYWRPDSGRRVVLRSNGEYAEAVRALLTEAVRCRLRAVGPIGCELSGGCDSGSVAVTAAGLLGERGKGLIAFTSVPRQGFDGPVPKGRIGDEGPMAALVADRWPNMQHELVRTDGRTPLDELDLSGLVYDAPVRNPSNHLWIHAIYRAAAKRGVGIMLDGFHGNQTISYHGLELFPGLLRRARLASWLRLAIAYRRQGGHGRTLLRYSLAPFLPAAAWRRRQEQRGRGAGFSIHSAIAPAFAATLDLEAQAQARGIDLDYQPVADGRAARVAILDRSNVARYDAGMRAAFRIDRRHPLSDVRLVEFCLAIPEEQYLLGGQSRSLLRRAMATDLPPEILSGVGGKGYQGTDWYEGLSAARSEILVELDRLDASPMARRCLDLPRLRRLAADWPSEGWEKSQVVMPYRQALLRGLATGRFIRRFEGSNG